jgi:flagellar basal-body rod protein FlgF
MKGLWVPLSGQIAQQRKVETIANNIANANTAGFKKDQLAFKEHLTVLAKGVEDIHLPRKEFSPEDFYHTQGAERSAVAVAGSYTIHEQGPLNPTNNPFDVALNGPGMLEVLTPFGTRFTRRGHLSVSSEGVLVTDQGFKVLQAKGATATTPTDPQEAENRVIKVATNRPLSISQEGDVVSQPGVIQKLSIVEFKDIHALRKQGDSLFINPSEENLQASTTQTKILQGFIEGSNINAIEEMSELMKAHRQFDSIQKAIQSYDSINSKAVNDVSRF